MTNEDKREVAQMIAEMLTQKGSLEAPEAPQAVPEVNNDSTPVDVDKIEESASQQAADTHKPAITQEQLTDILNDVRLEVRAQFKQPWVEAMRVAFQNPTAFATVNGKRTPLISPEQVNTVIDSLKKNGKFWPQIVVTALNENGDRQYQNTSYKREDGEKWKLGSVLKPQVEIAKS